MTGNTRTALAAILAADGTITKADADAVLKQLDGKADAPQPEARVIRTKEACRLIGVHKKTLRSWADAGLLVPCYGANPRQRIGYTSDSVNALLAGRKAAKPILESLKAPAAVPPTASATPATSGASKGIDPYRTIGIKDACRLLVINEKELDSLYSAQLLSPCFNAKGDIIGYTAESVRFILENRGTKVKPDLPPRRSPHDELALAELDGRIDENGYPIDELELSIRVSNCLRCAGINTIGDLRHRSKIQLRKIRGFGKKCIEEVEDRLAERGLELATADAKEVRHA